MCKSVKDSCPFAKLNIVPDVQQRKRRGAINMVAVEHLRERAGLMESIQGLMKSIFKLWCTNIACSSHVFIADSTAINHLLVMKVLVSCLLAIGNRYSQAVYFSDKSVNSALKSLTKFELISVSCWISSSFLMFSS